MSYDVVAPMYAYGGESAFELIAYAEKPATENTTVGIADEDLKNIAANGIELTTCIVHENNL
ncbi:MAG TPA: hypothetical protein VKB19_15950 [Pedobacter sp.]|nr:hypothetical protein [Pedobacter sp.]